MVLLLTVRHALLRAGVFQNLFRFLPVCPMRSRTNPKIGRVQRALQGGMEISASCSLPDHTAVGLVIFSLSFCIAHPGYLIEKTRLGAKPLRAATAEKTPNAGVAGLSASTCPA